MAIYKHSGSNNAQFVAFLNANKAGTFLESADISGSGNFTISLGDCNFSITPATSYSNSRYEYTNGSINDADYIAGQNSGIISTAILSSNALIMSCVGNSGYLGIGIFILTLDSNNNLALIRRKWNSDLLTQANLTNNFYFVSADATEVTALTVNTTYNLQKSSIFPVVLKTVTGKTTIPELYVSIQNELPTDGTQAVSLNDEIFITNGRIFVRGD